MCKACSLRNVEYKCRVNLQNKIKINEKDRVVICLSGGMNSICLTNILVELRKKFQKHLLFKSIEVVHVDLSMLSDNQE
jgi:tRNA(Ile)-lysidine synthase TilS/MesJ